MRCTEHNRCLSVSAFSKLLPKADWDCDGDFARRPRVATHTREEAFSRNCGTPKEGAQGIRLVDIKTDAAARTRKCPNFERDLRRQLAVPICSPWSLSWRKATKQKQQVVEFRLPRSQRFHQGLRKLLRDSEGQRGARELDPKWGRFLPQHRFNWDEIPWAFIGGLSHTWDMKVRVYFVFFGSVVVGCKHGACEPARQRFLHEAICNSSYAPSWGWPSVPSCCHFSRAGKG